MSKEETSKECCGKVMKPKCHRGHSVGGGSPIYCLGVVGALFYFLEGATTLVGVILGIGKAFAWPAILMFRLLDYLNI